MTMSTAAMYIVALLIIMMTGLFYKWWNTKHLKFHGDLPPGSMGLPFIGETLQFFSPSTSFDLSPFIKTRMQRYGPVFKTSLVGTPLIVSTDGDLNYFIFQQEGKLFQSWWPETFMKVLGTENLSTLQGIVYKYFKNMVHNLFGPESLKTMISEVENGSNVSLKKWSNCPSIEFKDSFDKMVFGLTSKKLISCDSEEMADKLRSNFAAFKDGLISFPLKIPGTAYYKCLQGRKNAMKMLKNMLQERKQDRKQQQGAPVDFFDHLFVELQQDETVLTEAIALDLVFFLLFVSNETATIALTLSMKFLCDYPLVLQKLTEEHETIIKNRENPESGLSWNEYKSMKFTFQFINETLRLANIAPGIFRKAMVETKFKGYTIPAGWPVMVCPPAVHLDPAKYEDPLEFNPWRWEGVDTNVGSRKFMAFGGGLRLCAGADFTKVQMAVFVHSLVTKYKLNPIKGGDIVRTPGLKFPNGFHVHISERKTSDQIQEASNKN